MNEHGYLWQEMNRTAPALAGCAVFVVWENLLPDARGACTMEPFRGQYIIQIDPSLARGQMYRTFLHEAGHAYINAHREQPSNRERAAWKQAQVWATWANVWEPADVLQMIAALRRLQRWQEE
jgi:hypothetical protein